jgi:glucose-1-phosphate adenylyltransferase
VLTQYKAHSLILHIQKGWNFLRGEFGEFVELWPAQQRIERGRDTTWYAGTADAVYQNVDIIRNHAPDYVLILAGDHVYKMDYAAMLAYHVESGADLTIGAIEVDKATAKGFGVLAVDAQHRVRQFQEKPQEPETMPGRDDTCLASMGIYVFNRDFLFEQLFKDADTVGSSHDFGKDIIPKIIDRYRVLAYPFIDADTGVQHYWRDVGTVNAFWSANLELIGVTPPLNLYDEAWPIWTYQMQLPPAKFVFDDDDRRGMAVDTMVSGGDIISGATVRHSLLFSNVRVNSFAYVQDSVVLPDVDIGRNCEIRNAVIDRFCKIEEGRQIGIDPDADRAAGFHVTEGGVTLVTPDMLGQQTNFLR